MKITWEPPLFANGPPPQYLVDKTLIALSYPPVVVRGTRFPGSGYYKFSSDIIPQNVAFTGIGWFDIIYVKLYIPKTKMVNNGHTFFFQFLNVIL